MRPCPGHAPRRRVAETAHGEKQGGKRRAGAERPAGTRGKPEYRDAPRAFLVGTSTWWLGSVRAQFLSPPSTRDRVFISTSCRTFVKLADVLGQKQYQSPRMDTLWAPFSGHDATGQEGVAGAQCGERPSGHIASADAGTFRPMWSPRDAPGQGLREIRPQAVKWPGLEDRGHHVLVTIWGRREPHTPPGSRLGIRSAVA